MLWRSAIPDVRRRVVLIPVVVLGCVALGALIFKLVPAWLVDTTGLSAKDAAEERGRVRSAALLLVAGLFAAAGVASILRAPVRGHRSATAIAFAVAVVPVVGLVFFAFPRLYVGPSDLRTAAERLKAENDVRVAAIQLLSAIGVIVGGLLAYRHNVSQRLGDLEKRLDERIEQLGSKQLEVRLSAIQGLGRLARESKDRSHAEAIRDSLAVWVRRTARADRDDAADGSRDDLKAALGILGQLGRVAGSYGPGELNLAGADLRFADLRAIDLAGAELSGTVLAGTDLSTADLRDARLQQADLSGADLHFARLERADLLGVLLDEARLDGADLTHTRLTDASMRGTSLRGVNMRGALVRGADLTGADLRDAYLSGADLRDAVLTDAWITRPSFDDSTAWPSGFDPDTAGLSDAP